MAKYSIKTFNIVQPRMAIKPPRLKGPVPVFVGRRKEMINFLGDLVYFLVEVTGNQLL